MANAGGFYPDSPNSLESMALEKFFQCAVSKATPETVDCIRDLIDQHFSGAMKKTVRESSAEKCYSMFYDPPAVIDKDIFAILDSTLDENFTSLNVCIPFPALESFSSLMGIITKHCPKLESLKVIFRHRLGETSALDNRNEEREPSPYTIPPGSSLSFLKSLLLNFYDPRGLPRHDVLETHQSLLSIVGKLCPVLAKLEVGGACMLTMDILALIVQDDMAAILFPKNELDRRAINFNINKMRLPSQFVNPLCKTLKELVFNGALDCCFKMHCESSRYQRSGYDCLRDARHGTTVERSHKSDYAFAFRHLPKLEYAKLDVPTIEVVELLYRVIGVRNDDQDSFENAWREAASRLGLAVESPSFFSSNYNRLSLKKLDSVPMTDPVRLQAVSFLCGELEHVVFYGYSWGGITYEIGSVLSLQHWSKKIDTVEIRSGTPEFMEMVFDTFGPTLKKLEVTSCEIDMGYLASTCTNLEHLSLRAVSFINDSAASGHWTQETFLSKLKFFLNRYTYGSCLGQIWGSLIEKKSSLTHLDLECCHIGTNGHSPRLQWSHLPAKLPNLESLEIQHCTGLTMEMIAKMIPQMRKLRRIAFPSSFIERDRALARKIMEDVFEMRQEPIEIKVFLPHSFGEGSICPFN